MEQSDWNGTDLIFYGDDHFFSSAEEVLDYCHDQGIAPNELRLIICEPTFASLINPNEYYGDDLPEDGEVPSAIYDAFSALNVAIKACSEPLCWYPGTKRLSDKSIADLMADYVPVSEAE